MFVSKLFARHKITSSLMVLFLLTIVIYSLQYYEFTKHTKIKLKDLNTRRDDKISFLSPSHESNKNTSIKIVLWANPEKPPATEKLARMQTIVKRMNEKNGESMCKYPLINEEDILTRANSFDKKHCEFSMDPEKAEKADAVVFFMFNEGYALSELPTNMKRKTNQLWIMYVREPPPISIWKNSLHNLINWTMSYRSDSDVWTPYGMKISLHSKSTINTSEIFIDGVNLDGWITRKSELVAGVISRCHSDSRREALISQLQETRIGKVDIFGGCGKQVCGRHSKNCTSFWKDLARQYKFYLAFENSLCKDYITEKFWRALELGMVPVVYGGGNYKLEAPPFSHINIKDFRSAKDVMNYLQKLDQNPKEYAEYFKWRKYWGIRGNGGMSYDWCTLCKAVYAKSKKSFQKTYGNARWWWHHNSNSTELACTYPYKFAKSKIKLSS